MRIAFLLAAMLAACSSQQLENNAAGWREAECDRAIDTPLRERCLREVRRYNEEQKK
ncbi:MAG TPA: hypothetical protein VF110_10840 [Burkholderiales bacterium]|jgi:hypothetical protein